MVDRVNQIRKASAYLSEKLGRDPTEDELAEEMNIPVAKISHLIAVSKKPASLETPISEDEGSNLGDIIADDKAISPVDSLQSKSLSGDIDHVISTLDPREADIIRLRFGLDGRDPLTLEEVGAKIGITREKYVNFRSRPSETPAKRCTNMKNNLPRKRLMKITKSTKDERF